MSLRLPNVVIWGSLSLAAIPLATGGASHAARAPGTLHRRFVSEYPQAFDRLSDFYRNISWRPGKRAGKGTYVNWAFCGSGESMRSVSDSKEAAYATVFDREFCTFRLVEE